ncbi:MAG: ParB N-terminal domain-containing protein [Spirochaetes bacterium]|nr:ParB N-terminal domain-containing protein [Spirochaetota bacterium]MBU0956276.1 ParB N-terminal domain-containing protein [Spirochaetota bacterium]
MQIALKSIKIRRRIRKDVGDITGLAESMAKYGQLHPIIINRKNVLIAGRRRLAAAKYLSWNTINAIVIHEKAAGDMLELELDENMHRSALTRDEVEDGLARLERLRNPGFFRRIWNAIVRFFRKIFRPGTE